MIVRVFRVTHQLEEATEGIETAWTLRTRLWDSLPPSAYKFSPPRRTGIFQLCPRDTTGIGTPNIVTVLTIATRPANLIVAFDVAPSTFQDLEWTLTNLWSASETA